MDFIIYRWLSKCIKQFSNAEDKIFLAEIFKSMLTAVEFMY